MFVSFDFYGALVMTLLSMDGKLGASSFELTPLDLVNVFEDVVFNPSLILPLDSWRNSGCFVYIYFVSLSSLIVFDSASMLIAYVHCEGSIWAFGAPKSHHDISNTLVRHSPPQVLQYTNSIVSSIGRLRFDAHTTNDM